jgi:predicted Zn-dependent protease
VATHELGHSLGLGHSENQNAIMAPFYRGYKANLQLDTDDILGITYLYGETCIH